ncbi:MAG: lecithin retinol acyltransferase family protein [Clostridia bacterium]|nr:lecithin retinol acyltransferase family protein [Clostridia bacterium]
MKGDVIYVVRLLKKQEQNLALSYYKQYKHRIFWQQFEDGFPSYRHYGIDIGDGTVVHFRGDRFLIQKSAWIQRTSMKSFLGGGELYIEENVKYAFPRNEVVRRALSQVGSNFGGYNFIFNNCEHFAYWCATGRRISKQVMLRRS